MKQKIKKLCIVLPFLIIPLLFILVIHHSPLVIPIRHNNLVSHGIGIARKTQAYPSYQAGTSLKDVEENKDVSGMDVSKFNLSNYLKKAPFLRFDSKTKWSTNLPATFIPDKILEIGKNPGLGIRALHAQGIDGTGVSIAIIDSVLFTEHQEYKKNLIHYEEMNIWSNQVQMHGNAVSSIAVGNQIGVAPGSKLYYIATDFNTSPTSVLCDFKYIAKSINRLLDLNAQLPANKKIRVISISRGFHKTDKNADQLLKAIERAKAQHVFVITTTLNNYYNYSIGGLGKTNITGNPDRLDTYTIGSWEKAELCTNTLMVPMDARTIAGFTGKNDYIWNYEGGLSWTCPYLAGLYALAVQVKPNITPEQFLKTATQTADKKNIMQDGKSYTLNYIINPTRLIHSLQALSKQNSHK
jgi:Subtilisin-like serine proteases